jgi:hypothetical protein
MEVIDHESPPRCELMQPGLQPVCGAWAPIDPVAMRDWRVENAGGVALFGHAQLPRGHAPHNCVANQIASHNPQGHARALERDPFTLETISRSPQG